MYAETGLLFPCFQNFSPEIHPFEDFYKTQKHDASLDDLVQASSISEYDLGGEGDLFGAPEPVIEDPFLGTDPMSSAISMMPCEPQQLSAHQGIGLFQEDPILSEVFYECRKDLLAKAAAFEDVPVPELMDIKKTPLVPIDEGGSDERLGSFSFQKSVSSGCLSSMDWTKWAAESKPRFLDFSGMDFETAYGMRRAFSEGDIKTLGTGNCSSEERREKLSRYRIKKNKRNFGRKIKYACRKALADSQPRIRGRFAKTEESETPNRQ